jgi:hypothetical protein
MIKKPAQIKETNSDSPLLTADEAQRLCDAHEVHSLLDNEEEVDLLERNNPQLLTAYEKLRAIADGDDA